MKIVTLNLWNGGRLFEDAQKFLLDQHADMYFLQEVYNGINATFEKRLRTATLLQETFPEFSAYFAPAYCDTRETEGNIDEGQLLLSRYPLLETENMFVDIPYGLYNQEMMTDFSHFPANIQKAAIEIDSKRITLLNVHGPVNLNGTEDDERRAHMREIILNNITEYTIVAGDFNIRPNTETVRALEKKLTNVFRGELETSFNVKRKDLTKNAGYAHAVVDMVFVTPAIKVTTKVHPIVDVSDHLPLVVEVEW